LNPFLAWEGNLKTYLALNLDIENIPNNYIIAIISTNMRNSVLFMGKQPEKHGKQNQNDTFSILSGSVFLFVQLFSQLNNCLSTTVIIISSMHLRNEIAVVLDNIFNIFSLVPTHSK